MNLTNLPNSEENSQVKIICPVDGGGNCFHERLNEGDVYMSFDCGFASNSHYKIGSKAIEKVLESAPQLVKDLAFEDEVRGIVWIPSVIQIPGKGIVFPDGVSTEKWGYRYAPEVKIPIKEQKEWPIPGQEGKYYTDRLDMEKSIAYKWDDFASAIANLGLVKDLTKGKK